LHKVNDLFYLVQEKIMWHQGMGCFMDIGRWFFGHGIFSLILSAIVIIIFVALTFRLIRHGNSPPSANQDALDTIGILDRRLARGEISEEEYHRLRDILNR
jgi:putative membrane protein